MERLWQDLRYGVRALARSSGFALVAVSALACYIPARRAVKVNPVTALRCE